MNFTVLNIELEEEERLQIELKNIEEAQMILEMNLRAQAEYLKMKEETEEAERVRRLEEERRNAAELERTLNEAKRLAEEAAIRRAKLEARAMFVSSMRGENAIIKRNQSITKAFVFSYYDLLNYLGTKREVKITKRKNNF